MSTETFVIPADGRILFFKRDRASFGFLSNFHDAPITIDGEVWRSTEFYYQAQKSSDAEYRDAIRSATSPAHAKALSTDPARSPRARKRSWFTGREDKMRSDWHEAKYEIMLKAVRAKFSQNANLATMLLATVDAEIVEDSQYDSYWGIGRDGTGSNALGKILTLIREELREKRVV